MTIYVDDLNDLNTVLDWLPEYNIYDYIPEEYIEFIRICNNGKLPEARFLSRERALAEAEDTVKTIDEFRDIIRGEIKYEN